MAEAPSTGEAPSPRKRFKLGPAQKDLADRMWRREAFGFLFALSCLVLNYTPFMRIHPGPITVWTLVQVVGICVFFLSISIRFLWTQLNAIEIETRDEAEIKDTQGSDDMGWTYYIYAAFAIMYATTGLGFLLNLIAGDRVPALVIHGLYISWAMTFFTPFAWCLTRIDLGLIATLFQRNNRLRTKITRLEQTAH